MSMENNEQVPVPELAPEVQQLVNEAFTNGPEKAIADARATGNAAIVDELHKALREPTVHDELVKRGKVAKAA